MCYEWDLGLGEAIILIEKNRGSGIGTAAAGRELKKYPEPAAPARPPPILVFLFYSIHAQNNRSTPPRLFTRHMMVVVVVVTSVYLHFLALKEYYIIPYDYLFFNFYVESPNQPMIWYNT